MNAYTEKQTANTSEWINVTFCLNLLCRNQSSAFQTDNWPLLNVLIMNSSLRSHQTEMFLLHCTSSQGVTHILWAPLFWSYNRNRPRCSPLVALRWYLTAISQYLNPFKCWMHTVFKTDNHITKKCDSNDNVHAAHNICFPYFCDVFLKIILSYNTYYIKLWLFSENWIKKIYIYYIFHCIY